MRLPRPGIADGGSKPVGFGVRQKVIDGLCLFDQDHRTGCRSILLQLATVMGSPENRLRYIQSDRVEHD